MTQQKTTVTKALAEYTSAPLPGGISGDGPVIRTALLDWLAVALTGSEERPVVLAREFAMAYGGTGKCSILGFGEQASPLAAALVNGISSHNQDYDDIHDYMSLHLETPVLCAALAAAEETEACGALLAEGIYKGMQVMAALGDCILPEHYAAGWHATSTLGIFGAAVSGGAILGLTAQQMCHAFGLAAGACAGLQVNMGSMAKSYQAAHAARQGLEAVLLARLGFTANEAIFDGPYLEIMSAKADRKALTNRLTAPSAMYELRYKQFPCGIPTQPGIINMSSIVHKQGIQPEEIAEIIYTTYPRGKKLTGNPAPQSPLEGKFSIPYCGAAALIQGTVDHTTFTDEMISNPQILSLMALSRVETDKAFNYTRGGKTEVVLKDGRRFSQETHLVGQSVKLSDQMVQVEKKFDCLMISRYGEEQAEKIKTAVAGVLDWKTTKELTALL